MSGVRGDARKRAQESQPAPEVGLTEAEQEALQSGYWTSLASTLTAVARIKAAAIQQERAAHVAHKAEGVMEAAWRIEVGATPDSLRAYAARLNDGSGS